MFIIMEKSSRTGPVSVMLYHHASKLDILIYLFIRQRRNTATAAGSVRINAKERQVRRAKEKKGFEAQVKPPTPTWASDTFIGYEEQNEKQKNKETGSWPPTQLPWTVRLPPMAHMDHMMSLFFYLFIIRKPQSRH